MCISHIFVKMEVQFFRDTPTHGLIKLFTLLLVKCYNGLLGRQISEGGMNEFTFFYFGDLFCIRLETKYANFFLKIGILFVKVYIKKFFNN